MSVLCCHSPDLLIHLTRRQQPALADRPLALLGPDETVWAASPTAQQAGIHVQMKPRSAQMRCPDLLLQPLDLAACQAIQSAFLDVLTAWQLPVEESGWGAAYVDLQNVAAERHDVQPLAGELGRQLRQALGKETPLALGWDHGKFTARAAASHAQPGRMKLVNRADEIPFLHPLNSRPHTPSAPFGLKTKNHTSYARHAHLTNPLYNLLVTTFFQRKLFC